MAAILPCWATPGPAGPAEAQRPATAGPAGPAVIPATRLGATAGPAARADSVRRPAGSAGPAETAAMAAC